MRKLKYVKLFENFEENLEIQGEGEEGVETPIQFPHPVKVHECEGNGRLRCPDC